MKLKLTLIASSLIVHALTILGTAKAATIRAVPIPPHPYNNFVLQARRENLFGTTVGSSWRFLPGDYNNDGIVDMYCINKQGGAASPKTEVHVLNGATQFKTFLGHHATALHSTGDSFDFSLGDYNGDGILDIWAIQKEGMSDSTEIHVLDGASKFEMFSVQHGTALHRTDKFWDFHVADWNKDGKLDLVAISKRGATGTELHVLDGNSNFQSFIFQSPTALGATDALLCSFALGDYDQDGFLDVYTILKNGASGQTEMHILDGTDLRTFLLQVPTALHVTDDTWQLHVANWRNDDGAGDMLGIHFMDGGIQEFHFVGSQAKQMKHNPWSDVKSWDSTVVPTANDHVVIPRGMTVVLDGTAVAAGIDIRGTLRCRQGGANNLQVSTGWIHINGRAGRLNCGTATKPFTGSLTVTLTGSNESESIVEGMGTKFIGTSNGGKLNLHGMPQGSLTWTRLSSNAMSGTWVVKTEVATNWPVGSQIAIAPSGADYKEAEIRTVVRVKGRSLTLDRPLDFYHHGEIERYSNARGEMILDERAEIAILSRTITIQGDESSVSSGFGGHIIVMKGSPAKLSDVRLYRMGQRGKLGRYPLHWHFAADPSTQYAKNLAIVDSVNRAITIHGTDSVLLQGNVAYNISGHAYFLEDGAERFNVIDRNLGMVNVRPAKEHALLDSDTRDIEDREGEQSTSAGPATFWISHLENTVTNNAAAGSEGSGFWYFSTDDDRPTGDSASRNDIRPQTDPMGSGRFESNTAHSSQFGFTSCNAISGFNGIHGNATFSKFTAHHTQIGMWPCDGVTRVEDRRQVFSELTVADVSQRGLQAPNPLRIVDSLFIGKSRGNAINAELTGGLVLYDAGYNMENIHFANFVDGAGAIMPRPSLLGTTGNRIRGASFENVSSRFHGRYGTEQMMESFGQVVADLDGSLTGIAGNTMVTDHPLMRDSSCVRVPNSEYGYSCPHRYARISYEPYEPLQHEIVRSPDGVRFVTPGRFNPQVIINTDYVYRVSPQNGARFEVGTKLMFEFAKPGGFVKVVLEGCAGRTISGAGWTRVNSPARVWASSSGPTWHMTSSGTLYIKFVAINGNEDYWASCPKATLVA